MPAPVPTVHKHYHGIASSTHSPPLHLISRARDKEKKMFICPSPPAARSWLSRSQKREQSQPRCKRRTHVLPTEGDVMYDGNRGPRRTSQLWLHARILELRANVRRLSLHHDLSYLINAEVPCGSYQGRGGKNGIFGVRWTRVWVSVVWTPACSPNLRVFVNKIEGALPASHDGGGQRGKRSAVCVACYYLSLTQISLLPSGSCNVLSQGPRGCARAGCLSQLSSRTLDGSPPPLWDAAAAATVCQARAT